MIEHLESAQRLAKEINDAMAMAAKHPAR